VVATLTPVLPPMLDARSIQELSARIEAADHSQDAPGRDFLHDHAATDVGNLAKRIVVACNALDRNDVARPQPLKS